MPTLTGKHAVVVGAGMGGLAAAGALSDHFERVTVIERDELPAGALPRRGVPQSNQLHGLLSGGERALSTLFPGFDQDLIKAGATAVGISRDVREELPGYDPFPQRSFGWVGYTMSRPLLELTARQRVLELPNVVLRDRRRALEILAADDGSVDGVLCESARGVRETLAADLVVDASARGLLTLSFLKSTGRALPEESEIGIDINYATTTFEIPEGRRDWKVVITFPEGPTDTRTGYLFPVEGGRWTVLISQRHTNVPSADGDEFIALARELRTSTIYDAIKHAKRVDEVHRFGFPESSWRHYEQIEEFPRGLLPVGDAISRFNPIYGQGIAMAVIEAGILKKLLHARAGDKDQLTGLGQAFLAEVQPLISGIWVTAAVHDFAHPKTRGERPGDLENSLRFGAALYRLAARDPEVHRLTIGVRNLIKPQSLLHEPELVQRIQAEMAEA